MNVDNIGVEKYSVSQLFNQDESFVYEVPKSLEAEGKPLLRKKNRCSIIHSSLVIEDQSDSSARGPE